MRPTHCKYPNEEKVKQRWWGNRHTVYGIETRRNDVHMEHYHVRLQQYLPFTVLKHIYFVFFTAEFVSCNSAYRLRYWNTFTLYSLRPNSLVATVLTVYGIETLGCQLQKCCLSSCNSTYRLRYWNPKDISLNIMIQSLQQYLPFTVLKRS